MEELEKKNKELEEANAKLQDENAKLEACRKFWYESFSKLEAKHKNVLNVIKSVIIMVE